MAPRFGPRRRVSERRANVPGKNASLEAGQTGRRWQRAGGANDRVESTKSSCQHKAKQTLRSQAPACAIDVLGKRFQQTQLIGATSSRRAACSFRRPPARPPARPAPYKLSSSSSEQRQVSRQMVANLAGPSKQTRGDDGQVGNGSGSVPIGQRARGECDSI